VTGTKRRAGVAQLVEQLIRNQQVVGSSPTAGSKKQRIELNIFSNEVVCLMAG